MSEANKIFVGGLDYNLTSDDLRLYFSKFGGIDDAVVLVNDKNGPFPGRSRGFGFITFNDESAIKKVMDSGPHTLGEKTMDIKVAVPKDKIGARGRNGGGMGDVNEKTTKLFVGGIRNDMTSEELKEAFLDDGVVSADVLMDRGTGKGRGFAFVVFDSEETVEALAKEHFRMIGDKQVEMKKAMPASRLRDSDRSRGYDDYGRGGGGGPMRNNRGGFRGGDRGGFRGGDRGGYDGGMNGMGSMPGGGMPYNQSPGWNMMNQGMNQGYNANGGYSGSPYGQNYGNYGNYGGNQGYGAGAGGRSAGGYGSNMGGSYGSFDQTSQAAQPDSSAAFHQLQQAVQNFVASTNTQPASNSYPGYGQTGTQAPAPAADNYAYGGQQTSPSPASQRAKQSAPYYR